MIIKYEDYMYHHGIKGMHWGVRRYQNTDGSLTNQGRKRYNYKTDKNYKRELTSYKKALHVYNRNRSNPQEVKNKAFRVNIAKEQVKMKNISPEKISKKSNHQLKLESKYQEAGLNKEQAEAAARRRVKAEKRVAIMAGVTLAACAAYYGAKKYQEYTDKIIKAGDSLQRIEFSSSPQLHERFYAAGGSHDKKRYEGMLGYTRKRQTGNAVKLNIVNTGSDAKIASNHNAKKIFNELYKHDLDFKAAVDNTKDDFGSPSKNIYDKFNRQLVYGGNTDSKAQAKFIKALKDKGYSGVIDINDQKYSGYNAKNPYIIFNDGKFRIMNGKEMTDVNSMKEQYIKELNKAKLEGRLKNNMPFVGLGGGVLAIQAAASHFNNNIEEEAKTAYARNNHDKTKKEG